MCNLAEEKYRVALIVQAKARFSLFQIQRGLGTDQMSDAAYTVIGELLEKGLIQVSHEFKITSDGSVAKVYEVLQEKRNELEQYVEALGIQKVQPDLQGKPRGLNYQIAEGLLQSAIMSSEIVEKEDKQSLLDSIYHYLALAQENELSEQSQKADPRQSALTEAHLRMLYAEYLWLKGEWTDAIAQALVAYQLFNEHGSVEKGRNAQLRGCEMLNEKYKEIKLYKETADVNHIDFEQGINEIKDTLSAHHPPSIFLSLAENILDKMEQKPAPMQVYVSYRSSRNVPSSRPPTQTKFYNTELLVPRTESLSGTKAMTNPGSGEILTNKPTLKFSPRLS